MTRYTEIAGAGQHTVTLTARHVQALTDGQFFLEHLPLLRTVAIEPYCRRCAAAGRPGAVEVSTRDDGSEFQFRCEHTSGWVKRDTFLEHEPLLAALAWDLRCTRCRHFLEGNNAPTDPTFIVACPCTVRTMANPIAKAMPATR